MGVFGPLAVGCGNRVGQRQAVTCPEIFELGLCAGELPVDGTRIHAGRDWCTGHREKIDQVLFGAQPCSGKSCLHTRSTDLDRSRHRIGQVKIGYRQGARCHTGQITCKNGATHCVSIFGQYRAVAVTGADRDVRRVVVFVGADNGDGNRLCVGGSLAVCRRDGVVEYQGFTGSQILKLRLGAQELPVDGTGIHAGHDWRSGHSKKINQGLVGSQTGIRKSGCRGSGSERNRGYFRRNRVGQVHIGHG